MHCSHCEKCCRETEMPLCNADIARLERRGHDRLDFVHRGADGIPRLRNAGDYCYFYDHERRRCREYSRRPLGCVIYPVNISVDGEVVIDELCPEAFSVGREEFESKGRRLRMLLDTIALEVKTDGIRRK
jgi:Fe-S-cluster containining protein